MSDEKTDSAKNTLRDLQVEQSKNEWREAGQETKEAASQIGDALGATAIVTEHFVLRAFHAIKENLGTFVSEMIAGASVLSIGGLAWLGMEAAYNWLLPILGASVMASPLGQILVAFAGINLAGWLLWQFLKWSAIKPTNLITFGIYAPNASV